jgi:hypothetical protein
MQYWRGRRHPSGKGGSVEIETFQHPPSRSSSLRDLHRGGRWQPSRREVVAVREIGRRRPSGGGEVASWLLREPSLCT